MKNKKFKKIFNILLLIGITLVVLFLSLKDEFFDILHLFKTINVFWLLTAVFLAFSYWFYKSIAMHKIIKNINPDFPFMAVLKLTLKANFFHAITPFASGGQPYEIYDMKKHGLTITQGTNVSIQSFIVYQIALVILGLIAMSANYFFHIFKSVELLKQLVLIGFIINTGIVVILFLVSFNGRINKFITKVIIGWCYGLRIIKNKNKTIEKWNEYVDTFHEGAKVLIANKKEFLYTILLNFIGLLCVYLVPLALAYSLRIYTINGLTSIISCAYVMVIGSFVPIPGGTGGLEYAFIQFFGNFVGGAGLKALMLLWRFITYYFAMILGAIVLNIKEKR